MHERPLQILLALFLTLTAVPACQPSSASDGEKVSTGVRERELPVVRVARVERREMVEELETTSVLESEQEIGLFPRTNGVVIEILAEEGDRVAEGDVLARLDDRDASLAVRDSEVAIEESRNAVRSAELAVEEAAAQIERQGLATAQRERDYERNVRLSDSGDMNVLSQQAIETSRLELDNARAEEKLAEIALRQRENELGAAEVTLSRAEVTLARARLALGYTRLVAPFDGVVYERAIRVGDLVTARDSLSSSGPAFGLTDIERLRAVFFRPQEELELFVRADADGPGRLEFHATAEAYPGRTFRGEILRISPTIDPQSGQFRVTARMHPSEDPTAPLLPGMLVRMHIVTDRHPDALVVPKRALRREGERRFVLALEEPEDAARDAERAVREVDVEERFAGEELVEVLPRHEGALPEGTPIVVVGSRDLAAGDLVAIDHRGDDEEPVAPAPAAEEAASAADATAGEDAAAGG